MRINATLVNLYHVCKRELWLHYHGIRMEHTSQTVAEGKLIGETTYLGRARKYTELELDGVKIDFYDAKEKVIHEVKKSDKLEHAHIAQVKFYLYVLAKNGIEGATAIIEYPKMKQRKTVELEKVDLQAVERWKKDIRKIIANKQCPPLQKKSICKSCSYFEFCWSGEEKFED